MPLVRYLWEYCFFFADKPDSRLGRYACTNHAATRMFPERLLEVQKTKKELSIGILYVLLVGASCCTSSWRALPCHCSGQRIRISPRVFAIDQIIFVTKQKGIKEIVLHHLFEGPGLYGDWFFIASMMIMGRALGAILKYNWYGYWRRNIVLLLHLFD